MPNTTSTPTCSRASTRAWAPVTRTGAAGCCGRAVAAGAWAVPTEVGPAEVGPAEVGPAEVGPAGVGLATGPAAAGPAPDCPVPDCPGPGRGGAGFAPAVRAGMSSGDGACALEVTGLLCSVIGWLPCHDVRGRELSPWGIKKPLVPAGSRGARAETGLVSSLRASQVRE